MSNKLIYPSYWDNPDWFNTNHSTESDVAADHTADYMEDRCEEDE